MTIHALDNSGWGFPVNCWVCEPANERGLHVAYHHDDEQGLVFADFTGADHLTGAPTILHGGFLLAVLDEALAWAAIAVAGKWAVTHNLRASFERPAPANRTYRVEAVVDEVNETLIKVSGLVRDRGDENLVRVRADADMMPVTDEFATGLLGGNPPEEFAAYTRESGT